MRHFVLLSLLVLVLAGCLPASIDPPPLMTGMAFVPTVIARLATPASLQASTEEMTKGLQIYRAQYCGVCHQLSAAQTTGQFGPSHDGMARTAQNRLLDPRYSGRAATPDEYLAESILKPEAYVVDGYEVSSHHMPSYAHLPGEQIDALVYL
ncbi:MAG TPA: hypothetical protein PL105_09710, partial [Caldilineaceae bacterium]|nr:hypothetical protein [Caldilineaceae bacterium]